MKQFRVDCYLNLVYNINMNACIRPIREKLPVGGERMRFEDRDDAAYVASANECTGLVPALHGEGDEEEARALYAVHHARRENKRKK